MAFTIADILNGPLAPYRKEPVFYWNVNTGQVDSRFFIYVMGLNRSTNEIYRALANDTYITTAGMTNTIKNSFRTRSKSVFVETFKMVKYSETNDIRLVYQYG